MTLREQIEILKRGVVDFHEEEELLRKLERGKPLVVKTGFDPTAADLHLGHTVLLGKMRQFQDLGHEVIFLVGDFTGMIGDPTGKSSTRKAMTREGVLANAETYKQQVFKVLDPQRTVLRFNSEWLGRLTSVETVQLASKYTVARLLERKDFNERFTTGKAISTHELLYPFFQAYDSVHLKADVELGGHDQIFNLLVARDIMSQYGLEPQVVMTVPLLLGTDARMADGKLAGEKMSKSLGNYIGISEPAAEIFGKVMSISDELMWEYFVLLSRLPLDEINRYRRECASGQQNPRHVKELLAWELTGRYHGETAAGKARDDFARAFKRKETPLEMPAFRGMTMTSRESFPLDQVAVMLGIFPSKSELRRKVAEGAVEIDGRRVTTPFEELRISPDGSMECTLRYGRKFAKIVLFRSGSAPEKQLKDTFPDEHARLIPLD